MGELISISEFSDDRDPWGSVHRLKSRYFVEYFAERVEDVNDRHQRSLNWDKTILLEYPTRLAIHQDAFGGGRLWIDIRRFVRDQCSDVIHRPHDLTYKYLYRYVTDDGRERAHRTEVKHGYRLFYFESDTDAVQFALRFSDVVSEVSNRHPARADVPESRVEDAVANPWRVPGES